MPIVTHDHAILYALTTRARFGPRTIEALILRFHEPQGIIDAAADDVADAARLEDDALDRFEETRSLLDDTEEELQRIVDSGVRVVGILDEAYPQRLRRLSDPPTLLYVRGQLPDPAQQAVAVVGTHKADAEGIAEAVAWGKGLAQHGAVVVSGLARGIDGGGHTGALAAGGETVAVLGSGFDNIYPPEHRGLAEQIELAGALVSEYPPATPLTKQRLVLRNRIIVGLADAVVVVRLHESTRGSMEAIRRARYVAAPVFLVAADTGDASQRAVAEGAIPVPQVPDFDLVLKYL